MTILETIGTAPPLLLAAGSMETAQNLALLAFGFGFVVFFHELGHFLAAKWAGVKVEQFAVGFGQALFAWRKGVGFRIGSTQKEYRERIDAYLLKSSPTSVGAATAPTPAPTSPVAADSTAPAEPTDLQYAQAASALGLGETEYRLNWIPLGGYVKMLGQDDLKPNSEADDPRAYNRQTIAKRMVIVSAGVIMNIILAAIGFAILFRYGFHVPPAYVGSVIPLSPAQEAGIQDGDRIISINGRDQSNDWTKVQLSAALCSADEKTPIDVERTMPDGKKEIVHLEIVPRHGTGPSKDFLGFGILQAMDLKAPSRKEVEEAGEALEEKEPEKSSSPDFRASLPAT